MKGKHMVRRVHARNRMGRILGGISVCVLLVVGAGWGRNTDEVESGTPPRSIEICSELNRLWEGKDFEKANDYILELHSTWGNYIPVEWTWVLHAAHFGEQIEESLARARQLRDLLDGHVELACPVLMDELDAFIHRTEDGVAFFKKVGSTPAKRAAERDPRKRGTMYTPPEKWEDIEDYFYFLVPEAILKADRVEWMEWSNKTRFWHLRDVPEAELNWKLRSEKTPLSEKYEIGCELVSRLEEEGGAARIVQGFRDANPLYLLPKMVDSLQSTPDTAIPALLAYLESPPDWHNDELERMSAVWALVRIGRADADVLRVLQDCSEENSRWKKLPHYAEKSIKYLVEDKKTAEY